LQGLAKNDRGGAFGYFGGEQFVADRACGLLVPAKFCGDSFAVARFPFGLWLLTAVSEGVVKIILGGIIIIILGVIIIIFSAYCIASRAPFELKNDKLAWLFGFLAGVLGGAYGMNGPPLVIYGTLRRWSSEHFRATLQGYFLPASLIGMVGYWFAGLWVAEVTNYFLISLPAALSAIFVGRVIHHRMKDRRFLVYVHVGLIAVGATLLVQAIWRQIEAALAS
jgi:uncharacterized membrane protein YfcA